MRFFVYWFEGKKYALALVHPYDGPVNPRPEDPDLGFCRIRPQPRDKSMVVSARSVIRGAVVVKDGTREEFKVMDNVDTDMFLRLMPLFPNRNMEILM